MRTRDHMLTTKSPAPRSWASPPAATRSRSAGAPVSAAPTSAVARTAVPRVGSALRKFFDELAEGWRFLRGKPALMCGSLGIVSP